MGSSLNEGQRIVLFGLKQFHFTVHNKENMNTDQNPRAVVQSWVSANPGLKFNSLLQNISVFAQVWLFQNFRNQNLIHCTTLVKKTYTKLCQLSVKLNGF